MWCAWTVLCVIALQKLTVLAECDSGCSAGSDEVSLLQASVDRDIVLKSQLRKAKLDNTLIKSPSTGADAKMHAASDLSVFLAAVQFDSLMFIGLLVAFIVLQRYYPMIYAHPATHGFSSPDPFKGEAPYRWSAVYNKSWFGWARVSYMVTTQEVEASCGLDAAMLLTYTQLGIELMATIGLPACMIGIPIYATLGGGFARHQKLSWADIGNVVYDNSVVTGEPIIPKYVFRLPRVQWIFWLVAWTVWAVVIYVQRRLHVYQQRFLERRMEWLRNLPEPRATTVLVTGIQDGYKTDDDLYKFFSDMFGSEEIKSAFVVKNLRKTQLPTLLADYEKKDYEQQLLEYAIKKPLMQMCSQQDADQKGKLKFEELLNLYDTTAEFRNAFSSIDVERHRLEALAIKSKDHATDEVEYEELVDQLIEIQEKKLSRRDSPSENSDPQKKFLDPLQQAMFEKTMLLEQISTEQSRIKRICALPADEGSIEDQVEQEQLYSSNGFVTFNSRSAAARCLGVEMSEDDSVFVLETPPQPDDVRYQDLEVDKHEDPVFQIWGYVAVAGLFLAFMPLVIGTNNFCLSIVETPIIKSILDATGMTSTADGVLPSIGLTILMGMLPTLLMWIFQSFFLLKANRWAQIHLQEYYFVFLMLLVILGTSIGINLTKMHDKFAESPYQALRVFAQCLPFTAQFYLVFVCTQWVTHALTLTRCINMVKFLFFKRSRDEETAREMAEPEDQDYYGMGSRSARFTLMLVIGLVFGTICPLMNIVVLLNFAICRLIYGYLIPFAERRKVDQGGEHWCMQMKHTHIGLLVYIVTMTGILAERARSVGPACVAAGSFLWWFYQYRKFTRSPRWQKLAYMDLKDSRVIKEGLPKLDLNVKVYGQPELDWEAPARK
jgi:hypothetical protein